MDIIKNNFQEKDLEKLSQKELIGLVLSLDEKNVVKQTPSLFKKIVDQTPIGIFIANEKRKIIYANEYYLALFNTNNNLREGDIWNLLVNPNNREELEKKWQKAIYSHDFIFHERYVIQSGNKENIRWIEEKTSKITDKEGYVWYEGIIQYISEQASAENERKIQEVRLQLALDATKQGIWDWHLEQNKIYFSAEYFRLLGYHENPENFSNQDWIDKIHPEDKTFVLKQQNACLEGKRMNYHVEYRLQMLTGNYHWFRSIGRVVNRGQNGKTSRVIGTLTDINTQKITEKAIIASEEKFRNLIENNPAGICIYTRQQFLYVNPEFCKLSGYEISELIHIKPYQIIHREERRNIRELTQDLFDDDSISYVRSDLKIKNKKAQVIWIDFHSSIISYDGEKVAIASVYDITQKKEVAQELKETNEELRATEEKLRQNSEELSVINDNLEKTMTKLNKTLTKERETSGKLEKKNALLSIQKKELTKTLKELKETQNQLIQSEKMASLGVLVAGLAHEINNTINYISVSSEGLKVVVEDLLTIIREYEEISIENVAEQLEKINKVKQALEYTELITEVEELTQNIAMGAEQTAEIVRGLRNFSRMDGGQIEKVDIHDSIESTLIVLHNSYKSVAQIEKNYQVLPRILGSTSKLNQVVMNIIGNAIDAIAMRFGEENQQGKINISTELLEDKKQVLICIQDNGIGISKTTKSKIFDPFFTTKDVGKGTGLGLAISLGIIENHGGKLDFESKKNEGTIFKIYLPITI